MYFQQQREFVRGIARAMVLVCVLLSFAGAGAAQSPPQIDAGFNPALTKDGAIVASDANGKIMFQPDGKIIVVVSFNNLTTDFVYRLNQDGTVDETFNCSVCIGLSKPVLLPDGKLVMATGVLVNNFYRIRFVRVNPDGSLESDVLTPLPFVTAGGVLLTTLWAAQPDGKFFIEVQHTSGNGTGRSLMRVNPDFTFDSSFAGISLPGSSSQSQLKDFLLLGDGKFFLSSTFIGKANNSGASDASFDSPTLTCSFCGFGIQPEVRSIAVQSTGKILIGGAFSTVNGIARVGFARLHPGGNVDLDFNVPLESNSAVRAKVLPDDKIIAHGDFPGNDSLVRLNADGTQDFGFFAPRDIAYETFELDNQGRVVFFGRFADNKYKFGRLNPNGSLERIFDSPSAKGSVTALGLSPSGKVVIIGDFDRVNGVARSRIARLNADGTLDETFNPGTGFNVTPTAMLVDSAGRVYAGGAFTNYNGDMRANFVRLLADGTLDVGYNPDVNAPVLAITLQPNGRILIGGEFTNVSGFGRTGLARLLTGDGTIDTMFNPVIGGNPSIRSIIVETDGKIVIGGIFNGINGFDRSNMARLNADGTLDTTFNASVNSRALSKVARDFCCGGKYVYLNLDGTILGRRNNDGSPDASFISPTVTGNIRDFVIQQNGAIVIGGLFNRVNNVTRNNIARLRAADGALDRFYLVNGTNAEVKALAGQQDNKVIAGGLFTVIEGANRTGLARINNIPLRVNLPEFDFNGDGKADISVFRPSTASWYIARPTGVPSQNFDSVQFGAAGDKLVPADYDGDGLTDVAVWRPTDGVWYLQRSSAGFIALQFGANGDIPMPGDFDGDGRANLTVFRPSTGSWYIARANGVPSQNFDSVPFGMNGDVPVRGDFDGDGKSDIVVFRPSNGYWYRLNSSNGQFVALQFGVAEDKPVPADYDGDGKTDLAVWRPSDGVWYRINSGADTFEATQFGINIDRPAPADYDGDGKVDLCVFRPSDGIWYMLKSTGGFFATQFGTDGDLPTPNAFVR